MRLRQCLIVSRLGSSLVYRFTSPRVHHLAGGGYVRGTLLVAICEKAGMRHKITVRNVVWRNYGSFGGLAPTTARRDASPYRFGHAERVTLPPHG